MTNRTPALLTTCLALALLPVSLLATTRIHVAPQGHDGGAGTVEHPLATPRAARDKVRNLLQSLVRTGVVKNTGGRGPSARWALVR